LSILFAIYCWLIVFEFIGKFTELKKEVNASFDATNEELKTHVD